MKKLIQYAELNEETYASKGYRGLNFFGKIEFYRILRRNNKTLKKFYKDALDKRECYIGPFIGEFGNFLGHILPFISHLNKVGVKVNYCGLKNQKPFFVNETGSFLLNKFIEVSDFTKEVKPNMNTVENLPNDIQKTIDEFILESRKSNLPFLDIYNDSNLYWYSFRNWQLENKQHTYNLSKNYKERGRENKVIIFPRKMNADFTRNNGGKWNYIEIAETISDLFSEVVFVGHPEYSDIEKISHPKIRYLISANNQDIIKECATAKLVITPHSGAFYIGSYTYTPVLLIFKGKGLIKDLSDSIRFVENFSFKEVDIAFTLNQIVKHCKRLSV